MTAPLQATLLLHLKNNFFLPKDVLSYAREEGWMIPDVQVVEASEYLQAAPLLESANPIRYEPCYELVLYAEKVGVSIRRHAATEQIFVIVKVWHDSRNNERKNKENQL